jgi:hypothetical protein
MSMKQVNPYEDRRAFNASAVGGFAMLFASLAVVGPSPGQYLLDFLTGALVFGGVLLFAVHYGGPGAFRGLWIIAAVVWPLFVRSAMAFGDWTLPLGLRLFHDYFVLWSLGALPLALAMLTYFDAPKSRTGGRPLTIAVFAAWIPALVASAYLARFASDVGMNPRDHSLALGFAATVIPLLPLLISGWGVRYAGAARSQPAAYGGSDAGPQGDGS